MSLCFGVHFHLLKRWTFYTTYVNYFIIDFAFNSDFNLLACCNLNYFFSVETCKKIFLQATLSYIIIRIYLISINVTF